MVSCPEAEAAEEDCGTVIVQETIGLQEAVLLLVGGLDDAGGHGPMYPPVHCLNPRTTQWRALPRSSAKGQVTIAGIINSRLYMLENVFQTHRPIVTTESRVLCYDMLTEKMTASRQWVKSCMSAAGVVTSNYLFCCGGHTGRTRSDTLRYDFGTDSWNELSPMLIARWGHRAVCINDRVYAIGGHDHFHGNAGESCTQSVEVYESDAWHFVAPMLRPRRRFAAIACGPVIYVFGGDRAATYGESYDSTRNQWQLLPPLPVRCFDTTAQRWRFLSALSLKFAASVVADGSDLLVYNAVVNCCVLRYNTLSQAWTCETRRRL